jgi:hypothetical protein
VRRLIALSCLFALVLAAPAQAKAPRALLLSCDRAHQAAAFEGQMDAIPATSRMQMRFKLQVATDDEPAWSTVKAPGFTAWVGSDPGRTRYVYTKRVIELPGPATYRVQMRFRWLDAAGAVLRATRASSRSCAIPDPRADLRVSGLEVRLGDDGGTNRYAVTVRNAGRRRADASDLRLTLPGQPLLTGLIGGLAPGQKEVLVLTGPACAPGETITATADAGDAIDESDELNDRAFVCPAAPSARAKR